MNDTDSRSLVPASREPTPEPPLTPASLPPARGQSLWNRIKSLLTLRTISLRDDLEVALEERGSAEGADFTESERTILQNVLKLGDKRVDDVMVERSDIEAIAADATLGKLIARFRQVGHSRLPVFSEGLDDISGFIHVKDALNRITSTPVTSEPGKDAQSKDQPVKLLSAVLKQKIDKLDIIRPAVYVPGSMPVGDLLQSMRASRVHMAVVVDEYGGTDGLVTIEDLLEAIVGEIEDEHDSLDQALVRRVRQDVFVADARAELDEVREVIGPDFDIGDLGDGIDTLGGLVYDLVGRVPVRGEKIGTLPGFEFEVLAADSRRVKRLRVRRIRATTLPAPEAGPGGEQQNAAE
ncbi:MAG: hemolysin [Devosia sp.]|nr:hemolysin [Devosia sp.]